MQGFPISISVQEQSDWVDLIDEAPDRHWRNVNCADSTFSSTRDAKGKQQMMIVCTGAPSGFLRSVEVYENFLLEFEWRHLTKGRSSDGGVVLWADPLPAPGSPFPRGVTARVADFEEDGDWYTSHGDVVAMYGASMSPDPRFGRFRNLSLSLPLEKRSRITREWNHYRILCLNGSIHLEVNGRLVSGGYHANPRRGYLCIKSSGGEVHYRGMRLLPLPPAAKALDADEIAYVLPVGTETQMLYDGSSLDGWWSNAQGGFVAKGWYLRGLSEARMTHDLPRGEFELRLDWRWSREGGFPRGIPVNLNHGDLLASGYERSVGRWNRLIVRQQAGSCRMKVNEGAWMGESYEALSLTLIMEECGVDFANLMLISKAEED